MDRFVRHIKRKDHGDRQKRSITTVDECASNLPFTRTAKRKFHISDRDRNVLGTMFDDDESGAIENGLLCTPAAFQNMPPPLSPINTEANPKNIFEQSTRVARRLQFDNDEMNTDVNNYISDTNNIKELCSTNNIDIVPPDIQTTVASYSQQKNDKNDIFQTMVESLTTRGFIVKKNYLDSQQSNLDNTKEEVTEDSNILSICGQFECLSVLEGIVYSVQAANKKNNSQINSVKILATVGSHPNIISYFSSWTDARFHYVQMELCQKNVYSVSHQLNNAVDFRTVLEHISCALHYLHDIKKYTHNKVNQWNIYQTMGNDTDCVVYKLGGFCSASKLSSPSETLVDIGSLCLTVLQLLKNRYEDFDINEDTSTLRSYLALVKDNVDSSNITSIWINGNNAFPEFTANRYIDARSIWRWCCSTRQQQLERRRRHLLAIMYQNAVCNNSNSISRTDSD